jgi:hypothetical protein
MWNNYIMKIIESQARTSNVQGTLTALALV